MQARNRPDTFWQT